MRIPAFTFVVLAAILLGACDFWPKDLESLAESISRQVSGEATALRVAGDIVLIDVAGSPRYTAAPEELETLATEIAAQAIAAQDAPLESIVVTFHEGEGSADPEKMREFIFLVIEDRPVLQPYPDVEATGPLTPEEVQAAIGRLGDSLGEQQMACVRSEIEQRARLAGDPETLDPATFEFLTAETWGALDAFGKRLMLAVEITTTALFDCAGSAQDETAPEH